MNISKQKVMFLYNQLIKSTTTQNNRKFLRFVLVSIIAPVKISMMPSAPPTTELPPPAAHQRPKISFSIDSIVSGESKGKKGVEDDDNDITSDFNTKVLNRSHPVSDSEKHHQLHHDPSLLTNKDLQKTFQNVNKLELLNQFRNVQHHPLVNLHHHIQQQLHFNQQQQRVGIDNGNSHSPGSNPVRVPQPHHLRYNFQVPPNNLRNKDNEGNGSAVNNRVTQSPSDNNRGSPTTSRSPSPSDNRKSPLSGSPVPLPGSSSPESRSAGGSPVNSGRPGEVHHGQNQNQQPHLPSPVQMMPPQHLQQFAHFSQLGGHGFPGMPGAHPHHPGMPPWGPPPNAPHHHPVAHPLYPWLLARHTRLFPPRFGPGAELPAFLFQPFRKPKRIRTAFSPSQLLRLEHAFEKNHYVVGTERKQLAKALSLSETQVKVWFQNRRTKHKRTEQEDGQSPGDRRHNNNNSENPLCGSNLSSAATSADSSTRHYSEEMSDDDEEIIMDDEYSGDEEGMVQVHTSLHSNP